MARGTLYIDTEVSIDPEDLEDAGYHHQDNCPGAMARSSGEDLDKAIDDLHRQAGHGDFPVYVCLREPCRSLYLVPAGAAMHSRMAVA